MNNWSCPKCENKKFETGEIRAAGGFLSKMFDIQNKKFNTVSCTNCGYTELYKRKSSTFGNVLDFFSN